MKFLLLAFLFTFPLHAHDTWVQLNTPSATPDQPVFVDLMLGNHGNNHRDFKLASKIPLENSTLTLIAPDGTSTDLKPALIDTGSDPKEGFWSAKIPSFKPGISCIAHTYDAIVTYAPKRSVKSAKTFILSGSNAEHTFTKPLGHPLEIIPLWDPTAAFAGNSFRVKILFKGEPLTNQVVSCIPRGKELAQDFDPAHEALTDDSGIASLPTKESNYHLIVTRRKAPEETGEKYSAGTEYAATLTLITSDK